MKKLMLLMAGVMASSLAMAHVVMTLYRTLSYDYGDRIEYVIDSTVYYLDDIRSVQLFSNSQELDHLGDSGIRVFHSDTYQDYFSSELDSITWSDYTVPGYGDFATTLDSYEAVMKQMDLLYRSMNSYDDTQTADWGFTPQRLLNGHPTLDTQAGGWDADFCRQEFKADNGYFDSLWGVCYRNIFRCNQTIAALELTTAVDAAFASQLIAEARTIRAFYYVQLATSFGRVPIFDTGEDHANCGTNRVRAENYQAMWDYIINDLTVASEVLDWTPRETVRKLGRNGTMTKGVALAYLGDAYMWKAYRCPELASECYQQAASALGKVIEEGPYRLNPSFATLWDPIPRNEDVDFNPEAIYVQLLENSSDWSEDVPHIFTKFMTACPANGGWGSLYLSWEWYSAYEKGDKRRDASCVTGNIPAEMMAAYDLDYSEVNHGTHPYLKEIIGQDYPDNVNLFKGYFEYLPLIWSTKWWRNARADWAYSDFCATNIYWKRLPNVMLDYAECLFNLGRDSEGWDIIEQLRQRAFGNLEVGHSLEIENKYLPEMNAIFGRNYDFRHTTYPLPLNEVAVEVPDARTYYTELKAQKGYESPVWKVAVNEERRKEFNSEWCLRPDMERSGYLPDHIEHNYPVTNREDDNNYPWTVRKFSFDPDKMTFPIPIMELRRNSDCDQNAGY